MLRQVSSYKVTADERVDFKGAVEEVTRTLIRDVEAAVIDWNVETPSTLLEQETFIRITEHDALGRVTTLYNWHRDTAGQPGYSNPVGVYVPEYNERGALQSEMLYVRATKRPDAGSGRPFFQPDADPRRNVQAIGSVSWNAKGQKVELALGNGTVTRYTYDPENFRLRHLYTRRGAGLAADCEGDPNAARPARPCGVQNLHYTYDPSGNVTHVQDDAQRTIFFANQQVEPSSDFTYDALYRLTEATGRENAAAVGAPPHAEGNWPTAQLPSSDVTRNYTQRYRYDNVGNFLSVRHLAPSVSGFPDGGWTREYDYAFSDPNQPASNRLWQTWFSGDRTQPVTYRPDDHGNMFNLDNTPPGLDVRWDWRDMIRALDLVGGGYAFYNYGMDKTRTRKHLKRHGGSDEDRIYLDGYELYRRSDAAGNLIEQIESQHLFEGEQRVLLVDDVQPASAVAGPNGLLVRQQTLFRYQYGNNLGSVAVELDAAVRLISYEEYHPYGTSAFHLLESALEAPAKRYLYTGMERDEESGLSYHGSRYYFVSVIRWASADPSGLVDGPNIYCYVRNNPMVLRDPTGLRAPNPEEGAFMGQLSDLAQKEIYKLSQRSLPVQLGQFFFAGTGEMGRANTLERNRRVFAEAIEAAEEGEGVDLLPGPGGTSSDVFTLGNGTTIRLWQFGEAITDTRRKLANIEAVGSSVTSSVLAGLTFTLLDAAGVSVEARDTFTIAAGTLAPVLAATALKAGAEIHRPPEQTTDLPYSAPRTLTKVPWNTFEEYPKVQEGGEIRAQVGDQVYSKHAVDRTQPSGMRYGAKQPFSPEAGLGEAKIDVDPSTGGMPQIRQAGGDYGRSVPPTYIEDVISRSLPNIQAGRLEVHNGRLRFSYEHRLGSISVIVDMSGVRVTVINR